MDRCRAQLLVLVEKSVGPRGQQGAGAAGPHTHSYQPCEPPEAQLPACGKGAALPARGGHDEAGRSQRAQGDEHTLVPRRCFVWEGERHCPQPRALLGPCPRQCLRGRRQTPSRCIQNDTFHQVLGGGTIHVLLWTDGKTDSGMRGLARVGHACAGTLRRGPV